jgi:hypothetical protein
VLRGAYGLHFGELFPVTLQQLRWNPPAFHKLEVQQPDLADPLKNAPVNAGGRATVFSVPRDLRNPYSHQYNLGWEAALKRGLKVQLGYVGSRTPKLLFLWNTNRAVPVEGIPLTTATINDRRPNADFFEIRKVANSSRGWFDAGRVAVALPAWHGMTADAAYWWSKALDTGGTYLNTAAGDDARQLYSQSEAPRNQDLKGPSIFDQAHSLVVHFTWQTPGLGRRQAALRGLLGRWTWSSVFLAKTGIPFTVISGSDGPGFGNVDGSQGDRPNLLDASILGRTIGHPDTSTLLLPRSAFSFIQPGEGRGNLGIGTFRRGGIRNLNASLARTWTLAQEKSITLRAESLNVLNTPQFAEPNFDLTSPSFGQITNTLNDGRRFQFALALRF